MAMFCFVFYTVVIVFMLLMCISESNDHIDAKVLYAVMAACAAMAQLSLI